MSKEVITFRAKVFAVEEKFSKVWVSGVGNDALFNDVPRGWFVSLEGSHEALYVGPIRPNIEVGDLAMVRISFDAVG